MDPIKEDELYDAVSRNDINNVKKNLQKGIYKCKTRNLC